MVSLGSACSGGLPWLVSMRGFQTSDATLYAILSVVSDGTEPEADQNSNSLDTVLLSL